MDDVRINVLMDELASQISEEEMEMLKKLMKQYKGREVDLLQDLVEYTYEELPVDMYTFLNDPYYLNLRGQVYPVLEQDLCELFGNESYNEAVLTGGIGWGKSTFSEISLCRMVYEVSCFRNPQKAFGLATGTKISFVNCSLNLDQAQGVVFHGVKEKLKNSPYFNTRFRPDGVLVESMRFPKNIEIFPTVDPIGLNVFGGVLDEVNFMALTEKSKLARGGKYDQAQIMHDNLIRRIKSRFMQKGKLPGILLNISSSKYPDDFTERMIIKAREDESIFVRRYAQWDTKPSSFYIGEYFKVSLGDGSLMKPEVIKADENETVEDKIAKIHEKNNEVEIIEVPVEYSKDFETDLDGSIRDLAGRPTLTIKPFIQQTAKIYDANERAEALGYKHPFKAIETTLKDANKIISKMLKVDSNPRFVHVDLALTGDSCGFAMGHVSHYVKVVRRNDDGIQYIEEMPFIVIDIQLKIVPPYKGEIEIADVRALLYELKSYGFYLQVVSFDQFQSADSIQQLNRRGIKAVNVSVDADLEPYNALKDALYEDRIALYAYAPTISELLRLEKDEKRNKVDHPADGSKDVSDAVAGVCYHCVTEKPRILTAPSIGLSDHDAYDENDEVDKQRKQADMEEFYDNRTELEKEMNIPIIM